MGDLGGRGRAVAKFPSKSKLMNVGIDVIQCGETVIWEAPSLCKVFGHGRFP